MYLVMEVKDRVEPRSHIEIVSTTVFPQVFCCDPVVLDLPVQLLGFVDHPTTTNRLQHRFAGGGHYHPRHVHLWPEMCPYHPPLIFLMEATILPWPCVKQPWRHLPTYERKDNLVLHQDSLTTSLQVTALLIVNLRQKPFAAVKWGHQGH